MDLSIIIVNWNSAEELRQCLSSIYRIRSKMTMQTIVVDNASYDGSAGLVSNDFPQVVFIQSEKNRGFASANNYAARKATGRYLVFLNPDTIVSDDALDVLLRELASRSDVGIV